MATTDLPASLAGPDAADIDEVIARLQAICAALPFADGVRCFAAMYLVVTQAVQNAITGGVFASTKFLTDLDVRFANRFLEALSNAVQGRGCCRSWDALFTRHSASGITGLQFALAGMNAHINFDLSLAVVDTLDAIGGNPNDGPWYADYTRVNTLLDQLEPQIRETLVKTALPAEFGDAGDALADFGISGSREVAWRTSQAMWPIRHEGFLRDGLTGIIDNAVAASSDALLAGLPWVRPELPAGL
jgi:hypothetical protein